jgi:Ca2+/H+ antiporter, TMEM165/GDT1 family
LSLEVLAASTALVAAAEVGDKTQLLSFALAARLRQPVPIALGILCATLANHAAASYIGVWLAQQISPDTVRWIAGLAFIVFGIWTLFPDRAPAERAMSGAGVFMTALVAFFIAEMGDKTQLATVALAARFEAPLTVTLGTTLGMMIANAPAVWLGERLAARVDFKRIRRIAAALFVLTGVVTMLAIR